MNKQATTQLNIQTKAFLDAFYLRRTTPAYLLPVEQVRKLSGDLLLSMPITNPAALVKDYYCDVKDQKILLRLYHPAPTQKLPALILIHGGGHVLHSVTHYNSYAHALATTTQRAVISINYQLAPENPYPGQHQQLYSAINWLMSQQIIPNIDYQKICLLGDSAGGALVGKLAMLARDDHHDWFKAVIMIYPCTDFTMSLPSHQEFAHGYLLETETIQWFFDLYLPASIQREDPEVSILFANTKNLPPTFILTAECDPLRDEGEAYAKSLQNNGVATQLKRYRGSIHGFAFFIELFEEAKTALDDIRSYLDNLHL